MAWLATGSGGRLHWEACLRFSFLPNFGAGARVMTDVELIELRYSGTPAAALRGIRAGYFALIVNPIIVGWVTKAMIDFLHYTVFYDTSNFEVVSTPTQDWLIIGGLFLSVGIYCSMSGMWGVAITDVIQFALAMIGCIWLAVLAVNHVGGVDELRTKVATSFGDANDMAPFEFIPDFFGNSVWLPLSSFLVMVGVQWWATWYPGAEPGAAVTVVQRMASCKNEGHALKATLWYQIAHYCLRPWPWIIVAFAAIAMYPSLRTDANPGVGFPMVIRDIAPVGLRGLLMVTFFAAFMSTISTQMNWGASLLVRDIYQRFMRPDRYRKAVNHRITHRIDSCLDRWCGCRIHNDSIQDFCGRSMEIPCSDGCWRRLGLHVCDGSGGALTPGVKSLECLDPCSSLAFSFPRKCQPKRE